MDCRNTVSAICLPVGARLLCMTAWLLLSVQAMADDCSGLFPPHGLDNSDVAKARNASASLSPKDLASAKKLFRDAFDLYKVGELDAADRLFTKGIALDPANGQAHFYYGEVLVRLNKANLASEQFAMAKALSADAKDEALAEARLSTLQPIWGEATSPGDRVKRFWPREVVSHIPEPVIAEIMRVEEKGRFPETTLVSMSLKRSGGSADGRILNCTLRSFCGGMVIRNCTMQIQPDTILAYSEAYWRGLVVVLLDPDSNASNPTRSLKFEGDMHLGVVGNKFNYEKTRDSGTAVGACVTIRVDRLPLPVTAVGDELATIRCNEGTDQEITYGWFTKQGYGIIVENKAFRTMLLDAK